MYVSILFDSGYHLPKKCVIEVNDMTGNRKAEASGMIRVRESSIYV